MENGNKHPEFTKYVIHTLFNLKDKNDIKKYITSFLLPFRKESYEKEATIIHPTMTIKNIKNKKIIDKNQKDILIISYNEGNKSFEEEDIYPIIFKISIENPLIIAVCTQESGITTYKSTYQSVLRNYLEKNNYTMIEKLYGSRSSIKYTPADKNVRTYVYARNDLESKNRISNEYNIKKLIYKSETSGLGEGNTLFKGSIFFRLELNKYKCIIVNSHLFYEKREEEFFELVKEFKLYDYYAKGYDIFFSGDLNFTLFNKKPNKIVNNYLGISKENFKKEYTKYNQLIQLLNRSFKKNYGSYPQNFKNLSYNFDNILKPQNKEQTIEERKKREYKGDRSLKNNIPNPYKSALITSFKRSIEKVDYYLTCKYRENNKNKKYNITKNNFIIKSNNQYIRVPSMCDRILFAIHDQTIITPDDFSVYLFPKKSHHKLISLSFSSELIHQKRSNRKNQNTNSNTNSNTKPNTSSKEKKRVNPLMRLLRYDSNKRL